MYLSFSILHFQFGKDKRMPNIVIIGGGPAGLSAAIYAVRAGMQATVLYKDGR